MSKRPSDPRKDVRGETRWGDATRRRLPLLLAMEACVTIADIYCILAIAVCGNSKRNVLDSAIWHCFAGGGTCPRSLLGPDLVSVQCGAMCARAGLPDVRSGLIAAVLDNLEDRLEAGIWVC